jgi:hypothetical protein
MSRKKLNIAAVTPSEKLIASEIAAAVLALDARTAPVADEAPIDIILPPPTEDVFVDAKVLPCVLSDTAKTYLQALLSQYIGAAEAEATVATHAATIESGLQLIVFQNPLRVEASSCSFNVADAAKDIAAPDILLNLNRQLAYVRMHP